MDKTNTESTVKDSTIVDSANVTIVGADNNTPIVSEQATDLAKNIQESISYDRSNFLTPKDVTRLKSNRYDKVADNFNESFVIKNKKTGQIVELKAANAFHAANLIGWRPRNIVLLDVISHDKQEEKDVVVENNEPSKANDSESPKENVV